MNGPALAIMARAPIRGQVKTRLQPELSIEQSLALYKAFLKDTVNLAVSVPQYTSFLAFTPRTSALAFNEITTNKIELFPQTGRNLGERMYNAMFHLETIEYSPVVLIGSDIPTLQPATLIRAIDELKQHDLCLGPASDGGYYLIGARQISQSIFRGVPWSTSRVLETTLIKSREAGLPLALLDEYPDIDTFADMQKLYIDIKQLSVTPGAVVPFHTKAWLEETAISAWRQNSAE